MGDGLMSVTSIITLQNLYMLHLFFHIFKYYIIKILTYFWKRKIKMLGEYTPNCEK